MRRGPLAIGVCDGVGIGGLAGIAQRAADAPEYDGAGGAAVPEDDLALGDGLAEGLGAACT